MKTKLLTLLVAISTINLMAATTFNYSTSVADQTIDGITVQLRIGGGKNDPAVATNSTIRLYANNTITIQGQNIKKISLTFAKNPQKDYASMSVDVGTLSSGGTSTSATDAKTDTWTGNANTITFTIGSTGQRVLKTIVVETGTGGGGGGSTGEEKNTTITYTATAKLPLSTDAFGIKFDMHSFSNGVGTIFFSNVVLSGLYYKAFSGCTDLTSVTIPNSVKTINDYAFEGCSGLTSITLPNALIEIGNYAFDGCSSLTSVTIPNSVTTIGKYAFDGCSGLTSITIPNSVTTIGSSAFYNCSGLTSVTIPNSVTTIGGSAFYNCSGLTSVAIPNSVKTIEWSAFEGCSGLTSVTIPNSVTTIGSSAFSGCVGLKEVHISDLTTWCKIDFGNHSDSSPYNSNPLFYAKHLYLNNKEITNLTIPPSIKEIKRCAFSGCSSLTSITIPNSVTTIGEYAFYGCVGLTSVVIPSSVYSIVRSAFYGVLNIVYNGTDTGSPWGAKCVNGYVDGYFVYRDSTKSTLCGCSIAAAGAISIPNSVTTIGEEAFVGCNGITSVFIGNSVYAINNKAFHGCSGLKTIYNNSNLDIIKGSEAYGYVAYYADRVYNGIPNGDFVIKRDTIVTEYLGNETDITIPNFVTTIGNRAFSGCSSLTSVIIPNSVTTIGNFAFSSCSGLTSVTIPNSVTTIGRGAFYGLSNKNFKEIIIPNSVRTIDEYAFENCSYLKTITLGAKLENIGQYAFQNNERLFFVNCYAEEPPILQENAFDNYDIYLQVPCEVLDEYKVAKGWKLFNKENVSCLSAEGKTVTGDDVIVTPSATEATFVWPSNDQADSYSLEITKDGVVFCTLKFNANGQLTSIAFAPSRGGEREMPAAEMTASGWQFTVTGLDQASKYGYTLDVLDASQQSIKHYEGEFVTDGYTNLEGLTIDNAQSTMKKMIIDNQLFIFRGNELYNVSGQKVK